MFYYRAKKIYIKFVPLELNIRISYRFILSFLIFLSLEGYITILIVCHRTFEQKEIRRTQDLFEFSVLQPVGDHLRLQSWERVFTLCWLPVAERRLEQAGFDEINSKSGKKVSVTSGYS